MNPNIPTLDLVGPGVDDDVRRLIGRYGAEAVKAALGRQTRRKPGMKLKGDWQLLAPFFLEEDARRWLEGDDPLKKRSNNSIAEWFAKNHPDPNVEFESTRRRIRRKLAKDRRYFTLVEAFWISKDRHSYLKHLEALRALCAARRIDSVWRAALARAEGALSDYTVKLAGPPPATLTMLEVEAAASEALLAERSERNGNILQILAAGRLTSPSH
jgi:hypothetical protein